MSSRRVRPQANPTSPGETFDAPHSHRRRRPAHPRGYPCRTQESRHDRIRGARWQGSIDALCWRPAGPDHSDIGMPEFDGLDVCREIRKSSDLPILFLSARDDEIDRVLGLEIGGDDYVTKPFSPRELVARVNVILRRMASRGQNAKATAALSQGGLSV